MSETTEADILNALEALWSMTMEEQRSVVFYMSRQRSQEEIDESMRFWRREHAPHNSP